LPGLSQELKLKAMRTLYFDLDGTILDVSQRIYSVYLDVVNVLGGKALAEEVYWEAKREQLPEEVIAKKSNVENVPKYIRLRQERLESPEYLKYDELIPRAWESLSELKKNNQLVLVTLRKSKENLHQQLRRFKIEPLFDKVLVGGDGEERWGFKAEIISSDSHFAPQDSIIIGDSEADILAGKKLRITTIAVLSGIRSKKKLLSIKPDYIIEDISQLKNMLDNLPDELQERGKKR
jgi:phosphoglycolate phosphatase-like HAD superfamily hydrolase